MNSPALPDTPGSPQTSSRRRNRRSTAIGVTAGLLGGGAIGLLVAMPSFSSAASQATTTPTTEVVVNDDTADDDTATDTPVAPDAPPSDAARAANATERIRTELQNLVDDGTITAAQADAVAADLAASLPEHGPRGPGGPGGRHGHPGFDGEVLAGLLGIDVETLRSDLRSGQTVAEIAAAQGVDVQTVIDSLVAEAKAHLDLSVESGRLTQDEADARLTDVTERITDFVNNGLPGRG
jgi:polyhydroxyalkanoate synthesis regulator phasin